MKISTFYLFNLSYIAYNAAENPSAQRIYAQQLSFQQGESEAGKGVYNKYMTEADGAYNAAENPSAQRIPSVIFDNASPNHTWVLTSEYSQDAFCEFDNCHPELPPIFHTENDVRQDVAFLTYNGTEILTYDVCNTAGPSSVIYPHDHTSYRCADYSGAKIKIITTPEGVSAEAVNNSVHNIRVLGERSPYEIVVELFSNNNTNTNTNTSMLFSNSPTHLPTSSPTNLRAQKMANDKDITLILACTLGTLGVCFMLLCIRYCCNKDKPPMHFIGNNIHGLFTRSPEKKALIAMGHIAQNHYQEDEARVNQQTHNSRPTDVSL